MSAWERPGALIAVHRTRLATWAAMRARIAVSGIGPRAPSSEDAQQHLQGMVDAIKVGQIDHFIPFNLDGDAIRLN